MRYLSLILFICAFGILKAQETTPKYKHDYSKFDENNDACNRINIALGFLNAYTSFDDPIDADYWILNHSQTSAYFKTEYKHYLNNTEYIGADPILNAQDTPEGMYVADVQGDLIIIKDDYFKDYINFISVHKNCQITGVGIINIDKRLVDSYLEQHRMSYEEKITRIREIYNHIQSNIENYLSHDLDVDESTEGGLVTFYYTEDSETKKLIEEFYGEMGKRKIEYFFDNEQLRFAFEQTYHYNAPIYMTEVSEDGMQPFDESKTMIKENRYYFYGKMIKWINQDDEVVSPSSDKFKRKEEVLLNVLDKY